MIYVLNMTEHPPFGKVQTLEEDFAATRFLRNEPSFLNPELGFVTCCVVENDAFEAAGVAVTYDEYERWMRAERAGDKRPRTWLSLSVESLEKLTGSTIGQLIADETR